METIKLFSFFVMFWTICLELVIRHTVCLKSIALSLVNSHVYTQSFVFKLASVGGKDYKFEK